MQPRLKRNPDPELLLPRTVRATDTQWAAIKRVTWAWLRNAAMEQNAKMQREAKRNAEVAADSVRLIPARARPGPVQLSEPARGDAPADLLAAAKERFRRKTTGPAQGP